MATRRIAAILAVLFVLLSLGVRVAAADAVDEEARRIAKGLQCPVCQGASVADSPSELADQMRGVIRRKVEQGESEQQIVQYFVERYGDGVLIEPPRRGIGLAVWLGPVPVLALGAGVLFLLVQAWLRRRTAPIGGPVVPLAAHPNGTADAAAPLESSLPYDARVKAELERFRRES